MMKKTNNYTNHIAGTRFSFKSLVAALAVILATLAFTSCNVEEFPHGDGDKKLVGFHLNLEFETDMPIYKEINYDTRGIEYSLRYIVKAYEKIGDRCDYSNPVQTVVVHNSELDKLNRTIDIELPEGEYEFYCWTDYVDSENMADLYYNTDRFAEITLNEKNGHSGSNDYRDAFRGGITATVTENGYATMPMLRPLGKYIIISNDVQDFITKAIERRIQRGEYDGTREINTDDYLVTVRYTMFMPTAMNIFSNRPIDAKVGIYYTSKMTQLSANEMQLGFDYVFVNMDETRVTISIEVKDMVNNEVISQTGSIEVPLKRSRLTILRGSFLTAKASGGIGIDPSFDGDFNIEIK